MFTRPRPLSQQHKITSTNLLVTQTTSATDVEISSRRFHRQVRKPSPEVAPTTLRNCHPHATVNFDLWPWPSNST